MNLTAQQTKLLSELGSVCVAQHAIGPSPRLYVPLAEMLVARSLQELGLVRVWPDDTVEPTDVGRHIYWNHLARD